MDPNKCYIVEVQVHAPGGPVWVPRARHCCAHPDIRVRRAFNVRNVLDYLAATEWARQFNCRVRRVQPLEGERLYEAAKSFWSGKTLSETAVRAES